ncbi:hypothetical protein AB0Y21_05355 [Weissella paramesenteroides]|uniref:hypothetical protein n=1 Tax=Weissella paramesenteroides TaxID=1249 RepID=UPI003F23BDE3
MWSEMGGSDLRHENYLIVSPDLVRAILLWASTQVSTKSNVALYPIETSAFH